MAGGPAAPSLVLLFCAAAIAPLGLNIVVPALPDIGEAFAAPQSTVQLTISVFLLLFGAGQLVLGPWSDRVGRRPVLLGAVALFVAASLWAALADSMMTLVAARALQAVGGCAALVVPRAAVRDTSSGAGTLRAMALVTMAIASVPAVAPLLGGLLVSFHGWPSVFLLCAAYGAVLLAWLWLHFPETLPPERRTRDSLPALGRRYAALFLAPAFVGYAANLALLSVGFMLFVSIAPALMIGRLGISPAHYGLYQLVLGAAVVAGNALAPRLAARWGLHRALLLGSLLSAAGLAALLGLSGQLTVARLLGPALLYFFANGVTFPLALTGAIGVDPRAVGASAAVAGCIQMAFAAFAVFAVGQFGAVVAPFALFALASALVGAATVALVRR